MESNLKTYDNGIDCEFRADGKLRGGKIIKETGNTYLIAYHGLKYREIELPKHKIQIL